MKFLINFGVCCLTIFSPKGGGGKYALFQFFFIAPKRLNILWWSYPNLERFSFTHNFWNFWEDQTTGSDVISVFFSKHLWFVAIFLFGFRTKSAKDVWQTIWMLYRNCNVYATSNDIMRYRHHTNLGTSLKLFLTQKIGKIGANLSQITTQNLLKNKNH